MPARRLTRPLGRRGIAAVEFALVAPLLMLLLIGSIEILTLYRTDAKLNAVAINMAQMISFAPAVTTGTASGNTSSLNDMCKGAVLGMAPLPASGLTIDVASVTEEGAPNGLPKSAPAYDASGPYYDKWEADSTVSSSGSCSTAGGTAILGNTASGNPVSYATTPTSTAIVELPCDNAIIVKVSVPYPGLTGLFLTSRPTLSQQIYTRWAYVSQVTELDCTGCTEQSAATQICNSSNTESTN
jgi:Flp pilus assembly protein TadG